jgi:hypothetical protein
MTDPQQVVGADTVRDRQRLIGPGGAHGRESGTIRALVEIVPPISPCYNSG